MHSVYYYRILFLPTASNCLPFRIRQLNNQIRPTSKKNFIHLINNIRALENSGYLSIFTVSHSFSFWHTLNNIQLVLIKLNNVLINLQFRMSDIKTAKPRIPSPRTGAMIYFSRLIFFDRSVVVFFTHTIAVLHTPYTEFNDGLQLIWIVLFNTLAHSFLFHSLSLRFYVCVSV